MKKNENEFKTEYKKPSLKDYQGITSNKNSHPSASVNLDIPDYYTSHENRGLAIIFSHLKFVSGNYYEEREETEKDHDRLEKTFRNLRFYVEKYKDCTLKEIEDTLQMAADMDHRNNDCIVVIVLSHGETGRLEARDGNYAVEELWKPFLKSQSLIGKPKLFFIQACGSTDGTKNLFRKNEDMADYFEVPTTPDILVMTYEASPVRHAGSCFIQALCDEFDANGTKDDLLLY